MLYWLPGYLNPDASLALKTYPDLSPQQIIEPFLNGGFWDVTQMNFHNLKWRWFDLLPSGRPFKLLSFFILGYYLMSTEYFHKKAKSKKLMWIYLSIGLVLTLLAKNLGGSMGKFPDDWNDILYKFLFSFGQVSLAFGYISIISISYQSTLGKKLMTGLVYTGRMSFSSYLGHTFFGILIFYPYAFGYFGEFSLWQVETMAIGIFAAQVLFSKIWLKYYSFGPLEWLWRSLTYGQFLSMKKEK
ncbi:MAG: hypothetical protein B7C24_15250 [Bacteroidetes bacterium 4572_77]|nr:MAG: hypothetical protein B7C24_15250 [Bacteroidetes bacterium 4572_77]